MKKPDNEMVIHYSIAAFAALLSYIITYRQTILTTYDSGLYALGAKTILLFGEYKDFDGAYNIVFPPLYSSLLSLAYLTNMDVKLWAKLINTVSLFLIVLITLKYWNKKKLFSSSFIKLISPFMLVTCVTVFMDAQFMWSEAIYILFTVSSIYLLDEFYHKNNITAFMAAGVLCLLAYLDRNVGILNLSLLAFCGMAYLLKNKKNYLFIIICILFSFLIAFIIWPPVGTLEQRATINPFPADYNPISAYAQLNTYLWNEFLPNLYQSEYSGLFYLLLTLFLLIYTLHKGHINFHALYFFTYLCMLHLLFYKTMPYNSSDAHRYLSPIAFPFASVVLIHVDDLLRKNLKFKTAILVLLSLVLLYRGARLYKNICIWHSSVVTSYTENPLKAFYKGEEILITNHPQQDNIFYRQPVFRKMP